MRTSDILRFATRALTGFGMRSGLMMTAMAIGVAAVVVLTGLGDGARRYVSGEFSELGTNLIIVFPGRNETTGGPPPVVGTTPRDLTLADAEALLQSPAVRYVAPLTVGEAEVSFGALHRTAVVLGTTASLAIVRQLELARGRFLAAGDWRYPTPEAVIGHTVRDELFGAREAIGEWIRIGDRRFRVVGVTAQRGQSLGQDMDEVVIVPVASAQALFNVASLFRIIVEARDRDLVETAREAILATIRERHEGEEDITAITQDAVLAAFDRVLGALTLTVGGIAAVSLVVAGILVMNVTLIAVSQRTAEIGLLCALGASGRRIRMLFLTEAGLLSGAGALAGVGLGIAGMWGIHQLYPVLPPLPPAWAALAAALIALVTGLVFAWLPAKHAAALDPVVALGRR